MALEDAVTSRFAGRPGGPTLTVEFPRDPKQSLSQDHEWCNVHIDGKPRRIRFHDYHEIYAIPGLYEHLFYDMLECCSPSAVRALLEEQLRAEDVDPNDLRVLDLGAGNGMVAEQLAEMGSSSFVGIDLIGEAADAAERDRPGLYEDYYVLDLTALSRSQRRALDGHDFNCLATVAALGFGDIPPLAFAEAYNLIAGGGWIALNIKEDFLDGGRDATGFSRLLGKLFDTGLLELRAQRRYRHRVSTSGEPLTYVAIVGVKHGDAPAEMVEAATRG